MIIINKNKEELEKLLVNQWQYKESQVSGVVEKLFAMNKDIQMAFESWLNEGVIPETPVFTGCNPHLLSVTYPIKPPAAFMLLDWISREPQEALAALKEEYGRYPDPNYVENESK